MEIVPSNSELKVETRISLQDVDQLIPGQKVNLRLSAFNRNTTPELSGELLRVSADMEVNEQTGERYYRATTSIPQSEIDRLQGLSLVPGMPVEAFFITANRTVISYFLKPIKDHFHHIFRAE